MAKRKRENTDIPGNAVGSHAAYARQMIRQAETLAGVEDMLERLDDEGTFVLGMSIRFPDGDRPEYLAVVRVDGDEGRRVAFHGALTLLETLVGVVDRLKNGSMQFKEDKYE